MEDWIEGIREKIGKCFTINVMNVEMSIEMIGILFSKWDFADLERSMAYSLAKRKEFVLANCHDHNKIEIDLLRGHQGLGDGYKKFCKLV